MSKKNTPRKAQPATTMPEQDIDALLDEFQVEDMDDMEEPHTVPDGWYAVSNGDGIIAYFGSESDACRYRLAEINRRLNP